VNQKIRETVSLHKTLIADMAVMPIDIMPMEIHQDWLQGLSNFSVLISAVEQKASREMKWVAKVLTECSLVGKPIERK